MPAQSYTLARSRVYIKRIEPKVLRVSSWPPPLWEQPPMCGQITEVHLFEKHQFFSLFGAQTSHFLGVIPTVVEANWTLMEPLVQFVLYTFFYCPV